MNLVDVLYEDKIEESRHSRVYGVVTAVVAGIDDPDAKGRVKVKFPWLEGEQESSWARVMTFMAGNDRGAVFRPEVNDEVLVMFEHGDVRFPYVIGALWNGKDKLPEEASSNADNHVRVIKSRSGHKILFDDNAKEKKEKLEIQSKAGHIIALDDASGKEKIEIKSKSGHKMTMNDSPGQEKIEIIDKAGSNKITIDSVQNAVSIESAVQLKIKANLVDIEATGKMTLKSNSVLTIQGTVVKIN